MKRPIENNSRAEDFVYEPFAGSGTTIIACEMTGRKALAIELEPGYVDIAILRWQEFTGAEAMLDGKTYQQVARARRKGRPANETAEGDAAPVRAAPSGNGLRAPRLVAAAKPAPDAS